MIYLDYNATTPVLPEVAAAVAEALALTGNPSSIHAAGRAARARLEQAREQLAQAVGTRPPQVLFTSGGTEASNTLLRGWAGPVALSATEHDASLAARPDAPRLPVTAQGLIDLAAVEAFLAGQPAGGLLSVHWANNETGVIQPVADLARLVRAAGWQLHCDAVQAFGKLPLDLSVADAPDFLSLSAHKLGGPKGTGALVARRAFDLPALLRGGGQERGRRGGTENLPGIVGFGVAASLSERWRQQLLAGQSALEAATADLPQAPMREPLPAPRLANTRLLIHPGQPAAILLMRLDLAGIAVSSGSACSSGKVARSHVLTAMGLGSAAERAIRLSTGPTTTAAELAAFATAWQQTL